MDYHWLCCIDFLGTYAACRTSLVEVETVDDVKKAVVVVFDGWAMMDSACYCHCYYYCCCGCLLMEQIHTMVDRWTKLEDSKMSHAFLGRRQEPTCSCSTERSFRVELISFLRLQRVWRIEFGRRWIAKFFEFPFVCLRIWWSRWSRVIQIRIWIHWRIVGMMWFVRV